MRLPDHIELSLAEAGELLEVLDIAGAAAASDAERSAVSHASHMITRGSCGQSLATFSTTRMRRRLGSMTTRLMGGGVRSPEAAERLGIRGRDAYRMLFEGEIRTEAPDVTGWSTSTRHR